MTASSISAGTINELNIGTCESTNILLEAPCSGDSPQVYKSIFDRFDLADAINY